MSQILTSLIQHTQQHTNFIYCATYASPYHSVTLRAAFNIFLSSILSYLFFKMSFTRCLLLNLLPSSFLLFAPCFSFIPFYFRPNRGASDNSRPRGPVLRACNRDVLNQELRIALRIVVYNVDGGLWELIHS